MATNPIISGEDKQVTIYHSSGAVSTAQSGVRKNDPGGVSELDRRLNEGGWSLTPQGGGTLPAEDPNCLLYTSPSQRDRG